MFAVTVLRLPKFFESNVAVPLTVKTSPETRLSEYVTAAVVDALYTRLDAAIVTLSDRNVMDEVAVGAPEVLSK